ncbi:hypothetical protein [Bradyrhizobium elkanii]|uniref:hypothetical protein n=1 Tax=Bradyrhizobium elkanii TaxID=29448 RepID=UPI003D1D2EB3
MIANGNSAEAENLRKKHKVKKDKTKAGKKLFAAVITKVSGTLLPRLNQHSGADGEGPVELVITKFVKPAKK